jgi:hypothetical protein
MIFHIGNIIFTSQNIHCKIHRSHEEKYFLQFEKCKFTTNWRYNPEKQKDIKEKSNEKNR